MVTHKCFPIFLKKKKPWQKGNKKMKIEDVIALTQAGFTKSEILKMTQPVQQTQQTQPTQPAQQTQPTQPTQPAQPTQPVQNDALLNAITNLTNVIQAGNVAATGLKMRQNQPETADQIAKRMMEIMN